MEACASAHHWAPELITLGHEVRPMQPAYVKPFVKRRKTGAADNEAICEAVTRPTMRLVVVKIGRTAGGVDASQKSRPLSAAADHGRDHQAGRWLPATTSCDRRNRSDAYDAQNADWQPCLAQFLKRKPAKIATFALANITARIAWAVMSRKEVYAAAAA